MVRLVGVVQRCLMQYKMNSFSYNNATALARHLPVVSCHHVSGFSTTSLQRKDQQEQEQKETTTFDKYKEKVFSRPAHFRSKGPNDQDQNLAPVDAASDENKDDYLMPHPCWSHDDACAVKITHLKPKSFIDYLAYGCIVGLRNGFDIFSGYYIKSYLKTLDERDMLRRCIFLETVAGVPGFSAGMIRHLHSLRRMQRDHGWIHTLLEEAENERMHLMTFLKLRKPGPIFRAAVIGMQTIFTVCFTTTYLISPHFCHRFVGYLEEQAVITYTHILEEMDAGRLPMWSNLPAPNIAIKYWKLPESASMRDVILVIRADEAHHRLVNHTLGTMDLKDQNPFKPGE